MLILALGFSRFALEVGFSCRLACETRHATHKVHHHTDTDELPAEHFHPRCGGLIRRHSFLDQQHVTMMIAVANAPVRQASDGAVSPDSDACRICAERPRQRPTQAQSRVTQERLQYLDKVAKEAGP